MKKLILAAVAAIGLFGVAACSDTDDTTTQGVEPNVEAPQDPAATPPPAPADEPADTMTPTTPAPSE